MVVSTTLEFQNMFSVGSSQSIRTLKTRYSLGINAINVDRKNTREIFSVKY